MKSKYSSAFDAVAPDEQKKQETINKLIKYKSEVQVSVAEKPKRRFTWNIKRTVIAVSTAAVLIFCAIFIPIMSINDRNKPFKLTYGSDLMQDITAMPVNARDSGQAFTDAVSDFSIELFKNSFSNEKNSLISATSVLLALAMTANGADGTTLDQMERVLGKNLNLQQLNEYLYSYVKNLPNEDKSRIEIANSIWFRENALNVNYEFLQTNANYYNAAAYSTPFNNTTVNDINKWVKKSTDGLIDEIIKVIPDEAVMYLINCVLFDAEWAVKYEKQSVYDIEFTSYNNEKQMTKFMPSKESLYLNDDGAVGFIKPYFGNKYSFAAILPDENVSIEQYVASLSGEKFMNIIENASPAMVMASLPKFEYAFDLNMNDALKAMGIKDAFSPSSANFSKIGTAWGNLFISNVKHKAYISVDESGTKAGAVTSVEMTPTSAPDFQYVILDRPFLYAIIDNATGLPVFMGTFITAKK